MSEHNMSLNELAARVEALQGPCRETDVLIARAVHWLPERVNPIAWDGSNYDLAPGYWFKDGFGLPRYTASIDAAMTLADSADDPLDILEEALATAREERDGIYFLPLHICAAALKSLAEKGRP